VAGRSTWPLAIMDTPYAVVAVIVGLFVLTLGVFVYRRRTRSMRVKAPLVRVGDWFTVEFDDERVTLSARPPGRDAWEQSFLWSEVNRVCFKSEEVSISDGIYIFTTQRAESFVVPTEATGGIEFWSKVIELGLFPSELAIQAATSGVGAFLCWPKNKGKGEAFTVIQSSE
jgi:hypothetical protein